MISRKDNLLRRPYEERRFENHRRKVRSALPTIDNRPPIFRHHVFLKLKKKLQENDRMEKIEKDNFLLLQKMKDIKRSCRVDHYWTTPLPQFVNKVAIYETHPPTIIDDTIYYDDEEENKEYGLPKLSDRKSKCIACSPHKIKEISIPEERVPWEPERQQSVRKMRSKSVPVRYSEKLPMFIKKEYEIVTGECAKNSSTRRVKTCVPRERKGIKEYLPKMDSGSISSPQKIVLTRGCLKLAVNFPVDTLVMFKDGNNEKLITGGFCSCKNTAPMSAF